MFEFCFPWIFLRVPCLCCDSGWEANQQDHIKCLGVCELKERGRTCWQLQPVVMLCFGSLSVLVIFPECPRTCSKQVWMDEPHMGGQELMICSSGQWEGVPWMLGIVQLTGIRGLHLTKQMPTCTSYNQKYPLLRAPRPDSCHMPKEKAFENFTKWSYFVFCFVFPGINFSKIHLIVILEMSVWASQAQVRERFWAWRQRW